jgi:hypothetical protein
MGKLLGLFGLLAFLSILATLASGIMRLEIKWHKTFAFLAVLFGSLHLGIILYFKFIAR